MYPPKIVLLNMQAKASELNCLLIYDDNLGTYLVIDLKIFT